MSLSVRNRIPVTAVEWLLNAVCAVYGLLIGAWIVLLTYGMDVIRGISWDYDSDLRRSVALILALFCFPLMFFAISALILRFCRKRGWDVTGRWRTAVLVLLLTILWAMTIDSPPIDNDHTIADIVPQGRDVEASYQTLMTNFGRRHSLKVVNPYALGDGLLYREMDTNAAACADPIMKAWTDNSEARAVIDKLAEYDVIADIVPGVPLGTNTPVVNLLALRDMANTYGFYCLLKAEDGEPDEGARQLAQFHSVVTKAQKNSSLLSDRMHLIILTELNVRTAYRVLRHPHCTRETVSILAKAFPPIPSGDISLHSPMIGEYLWAKGSCETLPSDEYSDEFIHWRSEEPDLIRRNVSRILFALTFRRNATVRMIRTYYEPVIAGAGEHPMKIPDLSALVAKLFPRPQLNNMGGWLVVRTTVPLVSRIAESATRAKVMSDLLAIELHGRLGEALDLPDYYTGKPYFKDEKTGKLTSVGPDLVAGTKDDISLGESY